MSEKTEVYEWKAKDVDDAVKQLWLALAREMFEIEHFILPSEANANKWLEFVREGLASGKNLLFVAKSKDKIVGFALAGVPREPSLDVAEFVGSLNDVYVLPEFRRKGIGKKLSNHCLKKMKDMGVKTVRLTVLSENKAAVRLYEQLGFKVYRYGMLKPFEH